MKVIGVYNIKGGVGKTATAVNIAYLAAEEGYRTLVWDLDTQAAATYYFRVRPKVKGGGRALVRGKRALDGLVKGTDFENLDLLPADFSFRNMDLALGDAKQSTKRLSRLLRPLAEDYDYLFLDCPPSISLVSENIFRASDAILVPRIQTTLSARPWISCWRSRMNTASSGSCGCCLCLPWVTMVDRRKRLHLELIERLAGEYPDLFATRISDASDVERMGIYRQPLPAYAPSSTAARAYRALWDELKRKL